MYDNYNYPPGADGPDAPWNQSDTEEKEFEVTISQTLSKNTTVTTSDYIPGGCFSETEWDIDGYHTITCYEPDDTSNTDWKAAYKEERMTPLELINEFKDHLKEILSNLNTNSRKYKRVKYLIKECSNWIEDDFEVCEE